MFLYHEIDTESVESTLKEGLKRVSRGDKGDDMEIIKTDKFLDDHRPVELQVAEVSRDNNIYAYLSDGDRVVDITDGRTIELSDFVRDAKGVVLRLSVGPEKCYVSDLDLYDRIKQAVSSDQVEAGDAASYWGSLVRLDGYRQGQISRPEVMITYDIEPGDINTVDG